MGHGVALPSLLPWLYRLADEENLYVQSLVLPEQRARLMHAVSHVTAPDDPETENKYSILSETLACVWGSPVSVVRASTNKDETQDDVHVEGLVGQPSPWQSTPAPVKELSEVRRSVASLKALQMSLSDLERRMLSRIG